MYSPHPSQFLELKNKTIDYSHIDLYHSPKKGGINAYY